MASYSPNPVVEVHEERIQRLESGMQAVVTNTALTDQKLDHVLETVKAGFQGMADRLDKGAAQFEQHTAALAQHKEDIVQLQRAEQGRAERWSTIKKAVLPLLAAAAGIIATNAGKALWFWVALHFIHH